MKSKVTWFHVWLALSAVIIIHLAIFDWEILAAEESIQVQYIPDDAFYYLVLARNFTKLGIWSFDSGFSVTSGFHPLLAYLLMFLYSSSQPGVKEFIQFGLAFSSLVTLFTLLLVWFAGFRLRNTAWLLILALMAGSINFIQQSVSILEWSLVILFGTLYALFYFYSFNRTRRTDAFILFALGLAGSLSRSDFGLLPLSILAGSLLTRRKSAIVNAVAGLSGAIVGVFIIFLHNYYYTGQFLQTSVIMKAYWRSYLVGMIFDPLYLALNTVGISNKLISLILLISMLLLMIFLRAQKASKESNQKLSDQEIIALTSANLCLIGYTLVYIGSRPIQPWYTANLFVPVFMLLIVLVNSFKKKKTGKRLSLAKSILSVIALTVIGQNLIAAYPIGDTRSPWPHQQVMRQGGLYLQQHPLEARVGSWNAGVISYYQGGTVINLDGLMNNDVYPYIRSNNLAAYLSRNEIRYVIDFLNMFSNTARQAGGYDEIDFLNRLRPIQTFDKGEYDWKYLTLFEFTP